MSDWREMTLADISSDISYGYTESAKSEKIGPKFLRITDIANGRLNWDTVPYCPISVEDFVKYKLSPGDIVVARTGATTGANYIIKNNDPTEAVFASYLIRYRIDQSYADPNFIGQVLRSITWQDYVDSIAGGSAQPGANAKQLGSFPILLPPIPEQCAIAAVLSSLDNKIDLLHRQNKTLEAMAETLFRQWFVEEADEGWEEGKVLDYCTHHKVGVKPQDFPTKSYSHYSIPAFDNNMNPIIENGSEIQSNKYTVIPNCLLFSKLNPNKDKRIWLILNQLNESSVCSTEFQVVLPNSRKYLFFLYAWLSIPRNYNEIASGVGGTSGSHQRIDPADIFNFPCPHIDDSYIESFNVAAEPIFMKMSNNRIQIQTLEKLRDTLLPKLMSGEVRVEVTG